MKKTMIILAGLLTVTQAMAAPMYRPYASCISPNNLTNIDVKQNVDPSDVANPFIVSISRAIRGNKITLAELNAIKNPVQAKDVLESFKSTGNQTAYGFELTITNESPLNMAGEYKAYFTDFLGRSIINCSYQITFGN